MNHSTEQLEKAIKKIQNRAATKEPPHKRMNAKLYRNEKSLKQKRKLRGRKGRLDINDKISMVHSIVCDGEYQADVAERFQVTKGMVSRLVKVVKKDPDYFDLLLQQQQQKEIERALIAQRISDHSEQSGVISSIPSL